MKRHRHAERIDSINARARQRQTDCIEFDPPPRIERTWPTWAVVVVLILAVAAAFALGYLLVMVPEPR